MPYSIPGSTKILIYFGNSTIFVYFSWLSLCLWICYGASSVHFTVSPRKKRYTLLPTHSAAQSWKRFKPLSVTILLWQDHSWIGKQHKQQKKTNCLWCLQSDQVALWNSYLILISNSVWVIFSLGDHQITFIMPDRFFLLSKPPRFVKHLLFLTDKTNLDGTPSKIKWKMHVFWYIVFQVLKELLIKEYKIQLFYQFFYFLLFYIASEFTSADIIFTTF